MPATSALCVRNAPIELNALAAQIKNRHRNLLRELKIEPALGGVVLRGHARAFYGKQMALHEASRIGLVILANEIVVLQ